MICQCGCGKEIPPKPHHKYRQPRYITGHATKNLWNNPYYKRHMSKIHVGRKGYWSGKKRPEVNEWLGKKNIGRSPWNKGIKGYMAGPKNATWKGGKFVSANGYIYILNKSHPCATKMGYVLEHRLVMEKKLDRLLTDKEIVHHINGIKDDNRIENLEVMNQSIHATNHLTLVNKWAKKFNRCKTCKTTKIVHSSNGFCKKCYRRKYYLHNKK